MRPSTPPPRTALPYLLALLIAFAPLTSSEAAGQDGRIGLNETRLGSLSLGDPIESDGSRYDDYVLDVGAGGEIVVDLTSEAFDTYIRLFDLRGGGMRPLATDDDGGDGLDSRLQYRLPGPGRYLVRVTSFGSSDVTGSYRLEVREVSTSYRAPEAIAVGEMREGFLDANDPTVDGGDHFEDWVVRLGAGQRVRVDMTSDPLDTYLYVGQGVGGAFRELARDDDGGDGLDASLTFTAAGSGEYVIRASTFSSGQTGSYRLSIVDLGSSSPAAREIRPGQVLAGQLDPGDPQSDGKYFEDYVFQAEGGQTYRVDLPGDGLDTYVQVGQGTGWDFSDRWSNDDGGDGLDASLTFTPASAGRYTIRATTFARDRTGTYRVSLQRVAGGGDPSPQPLRGRSVRGVLEAGDNRDSSDGYYDEWTFQGGAGETVSFSLVSGDFDPLIEFGIGTGASFRELDRNDDGGEGLDSFLTTSLPSSGTYTVRVRSWGGNGTGGYVLERR